MSAQDCATPIGGSEATGIIWTENEDSLLLDLVSKYGENNWIQISQLLSNSNSSSLKLPIQCLKRYQRNFNHKLKNTNPWTEDERKNIFKAYREQSCLDRSGWRCLFPGRSSDQINRYRDYLLTKDTNYGLHSSTAKCNLSWSEEQERRLFLAVIAYQSQLSSSLSNELKSCHVWQEISNHVPGRNSRQCRSKWMSILSRDSLPAT